MAVGRKDILIPLSLLPGQENRAIPPRKSCTSPNSTLAEQKPCLMGLLVLSANFLLWETPSKHNETLWRSRGSCLWARKSQSQCGFCSFSQPPSIPLPQLDDDDLCQHRLLKACLEFLLSTRPKQVWQKGTARSFVNNCGNPTDLHSTGYRAQGLPSSSTDRGRALALHLVCACPIPGSPCSWILPNILTSLFVLVIWQGKRVWTLHKAPSLKECSQWLHPATSSCDIPSRWLSLRPFLPAQCTQIVKERSGGWRKRPVLVL